MRNISKKMRHTLGDRIAPKMKCKFLILFVVAALAALLYPPLVSAGPILGTDLASFTVLGASTVTNTNPAGNLPLGPTTITGNVGDWLNPEAANDVTGLLTTQVSGTIYEGPAAGTTTQALAQSQLSTAIANLSSMAGGATQLSSPELAGLTLFPGVYAFDNAGGFAQVTGTSILPGILTLDGQGNANAAWVFEIDSTLTTSAATAGSTPSSVVNVINTGSGAGLFWNVGSSATIGTYSVFEGNILALASITLNTGATDLCGRALANTGAVTMDTNTLSGVCTGLLAGSGGLSGGLDVRGPGDVAFLPDTRFPAVPEPSTMLLLGLGLAGVVGVRRKIQK